MRELLRRCQIRQEAGEVLWYTGKFIDMGNNGSGGELALLRDVQVETELVDDHLWVQEAVPFLYISKNSWVTFQATIYRYFREQKGTMDYGLRGPHHIVPLRRERQVG